MMVDYMKAFGKTVREERRKRRLTLADFHYSCRIGQKSLRKIERGTAYPRFDTLLKICQVLEVKPSVLFALIESRF